MSDYNSSLPVRTENAGDVIAKIADATTPSQQLGVDSSGRIVVKLDDGSGNLVTSQVSGTQRALDVGINVAGVQIDPRAVRALTSADVVTANQGGAPWSQNLTQIAGSAISLGQKVMASSMPVVIASDQSALQVVGNVADGAADSGNSVKVGAPYDTTLPTYTNAQRGSLQIDVNGRLITKDGSDGPVTPGTVASFSQLMGGQYNTALPTLTTGQQSAIQVDSSGRILTVAADPNDHNYGAVGSNTLRTASQLGNATGAADFNAGATGAQTLRVVANQGAANATPWNENIAQFGGSSVTLGQKVMASSMPVTFASDQSTLPISAASLPLPTGASTSALQSSVQGTVAPGTAAANSQLAGMVYNTAAPAPTNGQQLALQSDSAGNLNVDLKTALPAGSNSIGNIGTVTTVTAVTAITNALPAGSNAIGSVLANLQVASAAVSAANPVPVSISSTIPGTAVQNYNTAAAVAAGGTSNHDYTVTAAKTFNLQRIWASGSGKLKVEVQVETGVASGVFNTKFVGFNSTATPNIDITVVSALQVAAGVRVRVIRTNKDNQAQDVYTTIEGTEV